MWWWPFGGTISDPPGTPVGAMFKILLVDPVTLEVGGDIDRTLEFDLYGLNYTPDAVLSFYLMSSNDVRVQLSLNDKELVRTMRAGPGRSIHAAMPQSIRRGPNTLTMQVEEGSFRFSHLLLWYHLTT